MEHSRNVAGKSEPGPTGASAARPRVNGTSLHPLLQLQSLIGNRAVQRLLDAQIHADQNEERAPGKVVNEVLNTPGEPLDAEALGRMESNFGHDFSGVRVHTGSRADESAKAVLSAARLKVNGISLHPLLQLQSLIGNRAVQRLLDAQIHADQNEERAPGKVVNEVLNTPGEPLDAETRGRMESNFGHDFGGVRVHTGSRADESAKAVQAHAYTSGQDIVFAEGRFSPATAGGQRLLAHELTHIVQQAAGPVAATPTADGSLSISDPGDAFEQAAAAQGERLAEPGPAAEAATAASVQGDHAGGASVEAGKRQVQRDGDEDNRPLTFPVNEEWRGRIGPTQTLPRPGAKSHKRQPPGGRGGKAHLQDGHPGGVVGGDDKGVVGGDVGGHTGTRPQHGMGDEPGQQTTDSATGDPGAATQKEGGTGSGGTGTRSGGQAGGAGKKPGGEKSGAEKSGAEKSGGEKSGRTTKNPSGGENETGGESSLLGDFAALASLIIDPDSLYEAQHSGNKGTGSQLGSKSGILSGWFAQALTIAMAFGGTIKDGVKAIGGALKKGTKKLGGWLGGESQGLLTEGTEAVSPTAVAPPETGHPYREIPTEDRIPPKPEPGPDPVGQPTPKPPKKPPLSPEQQKQIEDEVRSVYFLPNDAGSYPKH